MLPDGRLRKIPLLLLCSDQCDILPHAPADVQRSRQAGGVPSDSELPEQHCNAEQQRGNRLRQTSAQSALPHARTPIHNRRPGSRQFLLCCHYTVSAQNIKRITPVTFFFSNSLPHSIIILNLHVFERQITHQGGYCNYGFQSYCPYRSGRKFCPF